jgi:hypothetical protein
LIGVSDALGFSQRGKFGKQGNPVELIEYCLDFLKEKVITGIWGNQVGWK